MSWLRRAGAMAAVVAVLCIATIGWGERIGVNQGMGWDGATYVQWARDFPQVLDAGTTQYHAQRVLPSAVVYYALKATGGSFAVRDVIIAFQLLDALLLIAAAIVFAHLSVRMEWRRATAWVGFIALFGGFANARHALYYPALTDTAAFLLGTVVAWAYLLRHPIALWVCALLGTVTWPALAPIACVLLVVRRLDEELPAPEACWTWPVRGGSALIAAGVTLVFLLLAKHYLAHPVQELGIPKFATWVRRDWLPITVPLLALLLVASWYCVVYQPPLWNVRAVLRAQRWRYVAVAIVGVVVVLLVKRAWVAEVGIKGKGPTSEQFICLQTLEALRGPLWGIVHHVVYYGPLVVVAALRWRAICRVIGRWGHGAVIAMAMLVFFAAASESRQWIHLLPLLVAAVLVATDDVWTVRRALVFGVLAVAWSKLWLVIGYDTPGNWQTFPTQSYFMHLGPWASETAWAWHGAAAAVTAVVLWFVLRRPRTDGVVSPTGATPR